MGGGTDGRTDGRAGGRAGGWTDGQIDERRDGHTLARKRERACTGMEMKHFLMFVLKMHDSVDDHKRLSDLLADGRIPHIDRRDGMGNSLLWAALQRPELPTVPRT